MGLYVRIGLDMERYGLGWIRKDTKGYGDRTRHLFFIYFCLYNSHCVCRVTPPRFFCLMLSG